ncbi:MAG TPA: YciI family protein [Capsulimonadaceae bacterium]|nr:YciI family protein [Capsulimonadaceae bacterium]
MKYICLVYNEDQKLDRLSEAEFARHVGECSAWVDELEAGGRHVFSAGLQSTRTAATVRIRDGSLMVTDGPFAETKEHLGGFTILEARDLNDAIQLAAILDVARVGTVEVRPLFDLDIEPTDPLDKKVAAAIRCLAVEMK